MLIGSWALSLRAAGSPRIVAQDVDESLAQFCRWMAEHEPDLAAAAITCQHVESYLAEIASTRSASTAQTRYKRRCGCSSRGRPREGEVANNPMANVKPLIVPEQPVPVLTDDELRALLATCAGKGFEDRRDTATIRVLLDTGMRRDELVGLRLADVDVVGHVAVVLGKGRRERGCPFGGETAVALDRYLRVWKVHRLAEAEWLWLARKGHLTSSGLGQMLERRGEAAGLGRIQPTSSATPSPPPGWPPAAPREISCACPGGAPGKCWPATRRRLPTSAPERPTGASLPATGFN